MDWNAVGYKLYPINMYNNMHASDHVQRSGGITEHHTKHSRLLNGSHPKSFEIGDKCSLTALGCGSGSAGMINTFC